MSQQNFRLGQPVIYTARLGRHSSYEVPPIKHITKKHTVRRWEPGDPILGEGVIVGRRTLSNGYVDQNYYEEPNQWYPFEHFRAYLVADNIDQKPFFVLPEHLEEWSYGRLELLAAEL